jgi:hypothetical protein
LKTPINVLRHALSQNQIAMTEKKKKAMVILGHCFEQLLAREVT